jgi:hypothetical protein
VDFVDPLDPVKGIDYGPNAPHYATGYFPLRGVPSILVEMHAIKPYGERVRANERFLTALLEVVAKDPKSLLAAREKARLEIRRAPAGSPTVLESEKDAEHPDLIEFPTYAWTQVLSPVSGMPVLRYDETRPVTLKLPVFTRGKPKVTVPRPAAYIVPAGWPGIEERLTAHGIRFKKIGSDRRIGVGTYRAKDVHFAARPYQGRTRLTASIARANETREVPAGSLYVPLRTDLAAVAIHLLEPEAPDSLFSWGEMSSALEKKEWIDLRVLDPLAEEMLAKDPALRAEWEKKLSDPAFAKDVSLRTQFFYERTPFWDESVGLLPVYSLDAPIADLEEGETPAPAAPSVSASKKKE